MMPGPVLTATVGETLKRGFWAGPLIVLGHGLLEVTVLGLLLAGLGDALTSAVTRQWIGYIGGGLLMAMGAHMVLTARQAVDSALASGQRVAPPIHGPILAGVLTSMSNPYFYVWWATIGLSYVMIATASGGVGVFAFYSGHILSDLVWYSFVAAAIAAGRRICTPTVYRIVLRFCGVALVFLGLTFVRYGWKVMQ